MYLKKLSIQGFKSFISATDLYFDPGITAIVGPNGCGKSNIVDALRWVIGEQRARVLRSEKMDSVIFNGTSRRRAVGLAEVQLTISNTRGVLPLEYSEVNIGRRLYRSGEAEYSLNGVPCRLRDITDLFTDTGMGAGAYSVIELKMIDEILSENTQDRRRLFEEASGITRYKKRKTDALRKLDQMQADLARVQDLTDEISTRVRSLKRQATIAERFLRTKSDLRTAQIHLLKFEHSRLIAEEKTIAEKVTQAADQCAGWSAQVHACDAELETLRTTFVSEEKRSQRNRQAFVEHEQRIIKLEGDLRLGQANCRTIEQNLEKLIGEQQATALEMDELVKKRESVKGALVVAVDATTETARVLEQTETERNLAQDHLRDYEQEAKTLGGVIQDLDLKKVDYQRQSDRLHARMTHLEGEQSRLKQERESRDRANKDARRDAEAAISAMEEAQQKLDQTRIELQESEDAHEAFGEKILTAEKEVQRIERQLAAKHAEVKILEDLVNAYDFFPDAVRFLLTKVDDIQVTTMSDLITCAPEHRAALAAALEPYGGCIITQTEATARMAANRLRAEDMGRAYFIVVENIPSVSLPEAAPSNTLLSCITLKNEAFSPVVNLLLRDVVLVESLDRARDLLKRNGGSAYRYVTPQGEWIDGRGILYAGGSEEGGTYSHLAQKDSLRIAKDASSELQDQVDQAKQFLSQVRQAQRKLQLQEFIQRVREAEQGYSEADRAVQKYSQIREIASNQLASLLTRQQEISDEINALELEAQPSGDHLTRADQALGEVKDQVKLLEEEIDSWRVKLDQAQNRYLQSHTASIKAVAKREGLEAESRRLEDRQMRLDHLVETQHEEFTALEEMQQQATDQARQITELLKLERESRKDLDDLNTRDRAREHELRYELDKTDERLRKARRSLQEATQEESDARVRYSAIQARSEDLTLRASEDFGVKLEELQEVTELDDEAQKEQIQEYERKLQAMGNVNALALEEYEKQNERLEFMLAQRSDLEEAEKTLVRTIQEINHTATKQFNETYVQIQSNFQKLFCELFGEKAKCGLKLTEPNDALESPIAVTARPSGKRPVSIAQLSSGEKTLTAIALLFAIYLIKPSPFCFLDEVDAPLDDVNVDHFMKIIHRFASETQFILVTHNKRTMEMANRLYGVTMQEEGVSSLVGVQFEEAIALGR